MPQTQDMVRAAWDAGLQAVVGYLQPQPYDRRIVLASVVGPSNSTLRIYRGYGTVGFTLSTVFPADARTYDSGAAKQSPITIHAGESATFAWTGGASGAGQTASASLTSHWGSD